MTKIRYRAVAVTNTYFFCHVSARRALEHAERDPTGSFYFRMVAAVFSAFTVEGFLNHLGQLKVNDWEKRERGLGGPRGKLTLLGETMGCSIDMHSRPYETLDVMLRARDALAHGRTIITETDVILDEQPPDLDPWPEPEWRRLCTAESVARMVEDAEAIVRDLNVKSGSSRDPFSSPGGGSSSISLMDVEDDARQPPPDRAHTPPQT